MAILLLKSGHDVKEIVCIPCILLSSGYLAVYCIFTCPIVFTFIVAHVRFSDYYSGLLKNETVPILPDDCRAISSLTITCI